MKIGVSLVLLLFIGYGLMSKRLSRSSLTGPMIFTAAGLIAAVWFVESGGTQWTFSTELHSESVQILLEATLVIILFTDAVLIDVRAVRRDAFLPGRLLGIGLPLTIVAGTLAAMVVFPGVGFWVAATIAIILAPTDAALGQAVIANREVPALVRQGLGVESGLNDGIAVPFLTIAVAGAAHQMQGNGAIAEVFVEEIGFAIIVGLAVGWAGAVVVKYAYDRGWMGREWRQVTVVTLALFCFALADPVGGSGFIAAFVGGLTFGSQIRRAYPDICNFSEGVAHLMTMIAFFVFGLLILAPSLDRITWKTIVYALLSLTVIRMIPVAIALIGTGLAARTQIYIGWFGPRGLASLVFLGTVVVEANADDGAEIVAVGATVVGLSVLLHGITAWPASKRYAAWYRRSERIDEDTTMTEGRDVVHMRQPGLSGRFKVPEN